MVSRYKDAPNLFMWSVWDGVAPAAAHYGFPKGCYCEHSISAYRSWLKQRFTLEQLNQKLHRRYRDWAGCRASSVEFSDRGDDVVEGVSERGSSEQVRWQVEVVRSLDGRHEMRGHGAHFPPNLG